jgi:hypothetical protein
MKEYAIMTEMMFPCAQLPLDPGAARVADVYERLRGRRPRSKKELRDYVKVFLEIDVPQKRICPEHASPLDYLLYSFAADFPESRGQGQSCPNSSTHRPIHSCTQSADAIVWANRAGGKTELAAVATLLDMVFKPRCQVRILGGSGEQSGRMYEYLTAFLRRGFDRYLASPVRKSGVGFVNGANVEVLTQSSTSVRGQHVQKLRCDEVELFDEDVFGAAKFATQSKHGVVAGMELISTMHRPYGIMQREVAAASGVGVPVFKWCLFETIERCRDRVCSQCPLWGDCRGRAKQAGGYLTVDDSIAQMRRSSRAGWEAEMLCIKPSLENVVFAEFDPAVHVRAVDYDPNLPLYRSLDFGFVNPFVCLWIQVDEDGLVRVFDEYVRSRATAAVNAELIKAQTPCPEQRVTATFCDPAGSGRNDVTGTSTVRELRAMGIATRYRRSGVLEGIELIRRAIRSGEGATSLVVSPRCPRLIEALQCYHYADSARAAASELPLKDGLHDHPIDALRYFFVNHAHPDRATTRRY